MMLMRTLCSPQMVKSSPERFVVVVVAVAAFASVVEVKGMRVRRGKDFLHKLSLTLNG